MRPELLHRLSPRWASHARGALLAVAVAAGYVAGYKLASEWFSAEDQGASFFPPAGVTLGALVLTSRSRWPVVLAAAGLSELALDLVNGTALVATLGYVLANTAEPLLGALLLTTFVRRVDLRRSRHLAAFLLWGVIVAPMLGASIAATTFVHVDGNEGWARFAFEWWSGDGLGVLVVGSALVSLRSVRELPRRRMAEGAGLAVLAVLATVAVFDIDRFPFVYVPVVVLVVLAFRVGTTGVAVTSALTAFAAAGATAEAGGFWAAVDVSPANRILYLQLTMAVIFASVLALAAEISERERMALQLARVQSERQAALDRAALAEAERAARTRTERLQALTASLAAAASVSDVAEAVVVHGLSILGADAGFVALPVEGGARFEIVATRGWPSELAARWSPYPADARVPANRAAELRDLVLVESLAAAASEFPVLAALGRPGPMPDRAAAAAPLIGASGRLLGVVYVMFGAERRFDAMDRRMLQSLVSQGAQALERAVSFEAELEARRRADEHAARLALLYDATGRLAAAVTERDVADVLTREALEALPDLPGVAAVVRRNHGGTYVASVTGRPAELAPRWREELLALDGVLPAVCEGTRPVWVASAAELETLHPEAAAAFVSIGYQAGAVVPLPGERPQGALVVHLLTERRFGAEEQELLVGLAQQGSLALQRASSFDREQEARRRAELLETHAAQLSAARTPEEVARTTIARLRSLGIPAAWIQLVRGEHLEVLEAVGVPEETLSRYRRYPLDETTPPAEAARSGRPVVVATAAELEARYPPAAPGRQRLEAEAVGSFPFASSTGRVLGVLTVVSPDPGWLDESRRQLVLGLAEQGGVALERAELQAAADATARDTALLLAVGEALELAPDTQERARVLVQALTRERASVAVIYSLDERERPRLLARAAAGEPQPDEGLLEDAAARAVSARAPATTSEQGVEILAVPLRARKRVLGALAIAVPVSSPEITPALGRRIATRAALALDNALLYEQERDVSHALQVGLLGARPDAIRDAQVATAYRPGTAALEVGGDWYDVFPLPDGRLALVVGDVVGHGLDAAVAMGQLRGAVRALAPVGPPSEVLARLDDFVSTLPEANMATLALAKLDPSDGCLVYACAGHPPPLLVAEGGESRLLWDGRSVPLGSSSAGERQEASARLAPGDTIVLYTDGLIERRDQGISVGLDSLVEVATRSSNGHPSVLVDRLLAALVDGDSQEDDVCVLAVCRQPAERFVYAFPAAPRELSTMRAALFAWLADVGFEPDRRYDVVLAASEAAANAAEHAYGFDGTGLVQVEADLSDGELRLSVRDRGTWRAPDPETGRGRGRTIMEALMRDVTISHDDGGTVVDMRAPAEEALLS